MSTVYSDDPEYVETIVQKAAPYSGRVVIGGERVADKAPSPGMVSPVLVHGGPGKAGGGEELGGLIGLEHYLQRTGVQGFRPLVERLHDAGADEEK